MSRITKIRPSQIRKRTANDLRQSGLKVKSNNRIRQINSGRIERNGPENINSEPAPGSFATAVIKTLTIECVSFLLIICRYSGEYFGRFRNSPWGWNGKVWAKKWGLRWLIRFAFYFSCSSKSNGILVSILYKTGTMFSLRFSINSNSHFRFLFSDIHIVLHSFLLTKEE